MSLIDDAWRLTDELESSGAYLTGPPFRRRCRFCGAAWVNCADDGKYLQHAPDCSWLSKPRIVGVLEAAGYAEDMLRLLDLAAFREDHLAVLSLADRVRAALGHARRDDPSVDA